MTDGDRVRLRDAISADWREIGGLGRAALVGLVGSLVVTLTLGFSITAAARRHLLDARSQLLAGVVGELADLTVAPLPPPGNVDAFDAETRLRLVGGETVRVKLWAPSGTIVYSDAPELIGTQFALSEPAERALAGEAASQISDLSDPAHAEHRHLEALIEFYLPFVGTDGEVLGVFEVEQRLDTLNEALGRIARNVWLSIGMGLAALSVFLGALFVARARELNKRRRQAENLLGDLLQAQELERKRIVGSLHDDIGQPLYRLLYGLEGSRSRLPDGHPVSREIEGLQGILRDVDAKLRAELRLLHHDSVADLGLRAALADLIESTNAETDLEATLVYAAKDEPDELSGSVLFRAAREGLINVRKHSGASRVDVEVRSEDGGVIIELVDNGRSYGIVPGVGLTTMRDRLEAIGGGQSIESGRHGTTYRAWVPQRAKA